MRRERNNQLGGVWDDTFIPTAKEATKWGLKAVDGVTNVAKITTDDLGKRLTRLKRSRRARDEDDDGVKVKEVDWFYVSKDEEVTRLKARPRPRKKKFKRTVHPPDARRRPKKLKRRGRAGEQIEERNEIAIDQNGKKLLALPPTLDGVVYVPDLNQASKPSKNKEEIRSIPTLPIYYQQNGSPTNDRNARGNITKDVLDEEDSKQTKKRRSSPRTLRQKGDRASAKKKVYAVYPQGKDDFDLEEIYGKAAAGAIDSVGEFLADVASGEFGIENKTASSRENPTYTAHQQQQKSERIPKRRYWRDRLAERVDYALGVHEDGGYYKSWQDRYDKEHAQEQECDGNDPVSIFYGNQKKRQRNKKVGPFWEKDGSLMSLLFGRNSDGQQLAFNVSIHKQFCRLSTSFIILMSVCTTL